MLGTYNFSKYLISFLLTILLITNILYAFDLTNSIGGALSGIDTGTVYTDKYFGISTFLDHWQLVYNSNTNLSGLQSTMEGLGRFISKINFASIYANNLQYGVGKPGDNLMVVLLTMANTLVNIVWIGATFVYVVAFVLYIISVVFSFLSFILTFISGSFYTTIPSVEYPVITPLQLDTIRYLICH